ncbi:MAG TPA: methyltransferase domain-containing protein [Gemmataceae bacterium]|nr:methyltransferase domain-containing protein [Gemmataceae bacterium]
MHRRFLATGLVVLTAAFLSFSVQSIQSQDTEKRVISLKVVLPQADAKLTVNGKAKKGEGEERKLRVAVDKGKDIIVSTTWEPNNYTKITRTKQVAFKDKEVEVDLTTADPKMKDEIVVIYVPTPDDVVDAMCKMAKVTKDDVVYDLGCGDGRIVIAAVGKFGAKHGVGIDLDPERVKDSKENAKKHKLTDQQIEFREGNVLKIDDLSKATVVMLYMGEDINLRLRPILQKTLKPGSRIVSHRFTMGNWKPDKTETVNSTAGYECLVHLWTIKKKE